MLRFRSRIRPANWKGTTFWKIISYSIQKTSIVTTTITAATPRISLQSTRLRSSMGTRRPTNWWWLLKTTIWPSTITRSSQIIQIKWNCIRSRVRILTCWIRTKQLNWLIRKLIGCQIMIRCMKIRDCGGTVSSRLLLILISINLMNSSCSKKSSRRNRPI